jgi:hypothetical protein
MIGNRRAIDDRASASTIAYLTIDDRSPIVDGSSIADCRFSIGDDRSLCGDVRTH